MADSFSFDIVSRVDMQEVRNAVDQAQRELANRWDFKGSKSEIEFVKDKITLISDDDFKLDQLRDIVESKLLKRGVDIRQIGYGEPQKAGGMTLRQEVELKVGIPQDQAKDLVRRIKDSKLKVQSQIQGDEVRVSAKSKDDLQKCIAFVKGLDLPYPVEFTNYR
ncbi:MAG: UPF0234 protein [Chthonomonas sp.]|nr:YajQ family cyclic di-GMP-binding protein [Fimbriimonadaceae bacterium]